MAKILVLHGPNLNLLGSREPSIYGNETLPNINNLLAQKGKTHGHEVICFQSNAESELIDRVQACGGENIAFILINPAAFTHTSIALRDALKATELPFIEIHLSNIFARESFRQHSFFSDIALGVISGFGAQGYQLALQCAITHLA